MSEEVDISGCRYYRKDKNCDIWGIPCQMKEFCYFKILKQENANLKEENEKYEQYLLNIAMIIEELEQQYDDIKDFIEIKEIKEILSDVTNDK